MRFKLNKAKPNVIKGQIPSNKSGVASDAFAPIPLKDQISLIRDNSQRRDNWNLFVGDPRYKTNFFLRFVDDFTKKLYQRHYMPPAIYSIRLLIIDEQSLQKLKNLVDETCKPTNQTLNNMSNSFLNIADKKGRIEIRLKKKIPRNEGSQQQQQFKKKEMEETKTMIDRNFNQKDLFDKYEMAVISADSVAYQSQKAIMLTFNIVSEQRAKNKLLYMHSELTLRFLSQFNKRLQHLYQKQEQDEALTQSVIEFLGTTYLALNRIQQIQHEFLDVNESTKAPNENFLLKDEILHCVESLSIKCLHQQAILKLDNNKLKCLPDELSGDVSKFRLALQSVVEFAAKYCMTGEIDVNVNFDGMTDNQKYLISFDFTFNRNANYNEGPLIFLLNNFTKNSKMSIEEIMLQNYEEFFDLIYHFGIGMIIFPSLVFSLDGLYQISIIESPKEAQEEELKTLEASTQQLHPQPAVSGKIKINFKIPFGNPEMTKKVLSPYFPFNPFKEEAGGKKIYVSPLQKSREYRKQQVDEMREIMNKSKSPLIQPKQLEKTPINQIIPPFNQQSPQKIESIVPSTKQDDSRKITPTTALNIKSESVFLPERKTSAMPIQKQFISHEMNAKQSNNNQEYFRNRRLTVNNMDISFKPNIGSKESNKAIPAPSAKQNSQKTLTAQNLLPRQVSLKHKAQALYHLNSHNQEDHAPVLNAKSHDLIKKKPDIYFDEPLDTKRSKSNNYIPPIPEQSQGVNLDPPVVESEIKQRGNKPSLFIHVKHLDDRKNSDESNENQINLNINRKSKPQIQAQTPGIRQPDKEFIKGNPQMQQVRRRSNNHPSQLQQPQSSSQKVQNPQEEEEKKESQMMNMAASFGEIAMTQRKISKLKEEEKNSMRRYAIEAAAGALQVEFITDGRENFESDEIIEEEVGQMQIELPLSKHIQSEVLYSPSYGASKNLLHQSPSRSFQGDSSHKMNGKLNQERTDQNEEVKSSSLVNFPYKRGRQTLIYQEQMKSLDYKKQNELCFWDLENYMKNRPQPNIIDVGNGQVIQQDPRGTQQRQGTVIDVSQKYVLVVEDNGYISKAIETQLEMLNVKGIVADNGKIAVDKFINFMNEGLLFEFILMDIIMPEMGGYDATTRIRQVEKELNLAEFEKHFICGFSADTNPTVIKKCQDCGMSDILAKPMSFETLQQLVESNRRETNEIGAYNHNASKNEFDNKDLTILPVHAHS